MNRCQMDADACWCRDAVVVVSLCLCLQSHAYQALAADRCAAGVIDLNSSFAMIVGVYIDRQLTSLTVMQMQRQEHSIVKQASAVSVALFDFVSVIASLSLS